MNNVASRITDEIIKHNNINCKSDDLAPIIFFRPGTVRLTYKGYLELKKIYTEHSFPKDKLTSKQLIALYRNSVYPYYIGGKKLSLFDGEDAFAVTLHGSIEGWLDTL